MERRGRRCGVNKGFTLIELLVVIAIIALLVSILLPSLAKAKELAQALKCATNMKAQSTQLSIYAAEFDYYPPSYMYPDEKWNGKGIPRWNMDGSPASGDVNGYLHWSYMLLGTSEMTDQMFACPTMRTGQGGMPRTNPGPDKANWVSGQVDSQNSESPSGDSMTDAQAVWTAYTANAAIVPRNKWTLERKVGSQSGNNTRLNRLVSSDEIMGGADTIIVTEFVDNWKAVEVQSKGGNRIKSHRPVHGFLDEGYGPKILAGNASSYGVLHHADPRKGNQLFDYETILTSKVDMLEQGSRTQLNAVGRHHPGARSDGMGGTANFAYVDGHVERKHVEETLKNQEWGSRFYSITGENEIMSFYTGQPMR